MSATPLAASDDRVALSRALHPLVLAVDIGSLASRGDVFDAAGRPVEGGRRKIRTSSPPADACQRTGRLGPAGPGATGPTCWKPRSHR